MNISKPFFSVVMPAFNVEVYISEAIESVLSQTYDDWELIIVDDLSTDSTFNIAERYAQKDPRIKIFKMTQNSGSAYKPRKLAIEKSIGEYIISLDADDTVELGYLKKIDERVNSTKADIVYARMVNEMMSLPIASFDINQILEGKDAVKYTLNGWRIGANGAAIKRYVYDKTFEKYPTCHTEMNADEILTRQLLIEANSVCFTSARYFYRINNESITKRFGIHRFSVLETNLQLKELIHHNYPQNSEEWTSIETQCMNALSSCLELFYINKKQLGEYTQELNSRFIAFYNQINWSLINVRPSLKIDILKHNLSTMKIYCRLACFYHGFIKTLKMV